MYASQFEAEASIAGQLGRVNRRKGKGTMTPSEMKEVHDRHVAAEDRRDLEGALATYVEDCFYEVVALGARVQGKDAVRGVYAGTMTGLPDGKFQIDGEVFGEDKLIAWGTFHATADGTFLGQEPTGKRVAFPMIVINAFRDGLMEGERIYFDLATICEQAGYDIARVRQATAPLRAAAARA
jgi:steroid delta-isomerase-like uncharacterized protein